MIARTAPLLAAALASLLCGCVTKKNDGLGIGGQVIPEAVAPPGTGVALSSEQPSVASHSREAWEPTEFLVPVHGVAHTPQYAKSYPRTRITPRQRGEYPTTDSAMDLVAGSARKQRREALFAPVRALGSAILIVPKAIIKRRPWQTQWSPRLVGYDRYPEAPAAGG